MSSAYRSCARHEARPHALYIYTAFSCSVIFQYMSAHTGNWFWVVLWVAHTRADPEPTDPRLVKFLLLPNQNQEKSRKFPGATCFALAFCGSLYPSGRRRVMKNSNRLITFFAKFHRKLNCSFEKLDIHPPPYWLLALERRASTQIKQYFGQK